MSCCNAKKHVTVFGSPVDDFAESTRSGKQSCDSEGADPCPLTGPPWSWEWVAKPSIDERQRHRHKHGQQQRKKRTNVRIKTNGYTHREKDQGPVAHDCLADHKASNKRQQARMPFTCQVAYS